MKESNPAETIVTERLPLSVLPFFLAWYFKTPTSSVPLYRRNFVVNDNNDTENRRTYVYRFLFLPSDVRRNNMDESH